MDCLSWLALPALNLSFSMGLECYYSGSNHYLRTVLTTAGPLAFMLLVTLFFMLRPRSNRSDAASTILLLMYMVLPSAISTAFSTLPCDSFEDGTESLRIDHSITCLDSTYTWMSTYSTGHDLPLAPRAYFLRPYLDY